MTQRWINRLYPLFGSLFSVVQGIVYEGRWKHDFATVFIWKLRMVRRGTYGCCMDKGRTVVVYTLSADLS